MCPTDSPITSLSQTRQTLFFLPNIGLEKSPCSDAGLRPGAESAVGTCRVFLCIRKRSKKERFALLPLGVVAQQCCACDITEWLRTQMRGGRTWVLGGTTGLECARAHASLQTPCNMRGLTAATMGLFFSYL